MRLLFDAALVHKEFGGLFRLLYMMVLTHKSSCVFSDFLCHPCGCWFTG